MGTNDQLTWRTGVEKWVAKLTPSHGALVPKKGVKNAPIPNSLMRVSNRYHLTARDYTQTVPPLTLSDAEVNAIMTDKTRGPRRLF